jgi:hypothetical protein
MGRIIGLLPFVLPAALCAAPALGPVTGLDLSNLAQAQVAADPQGNLIVAGDALNCNLPVVQTLASCGALWVAKLDPTGQTILFATSFGKNIHAARR